MTCETWAESTATVRSCNWHNPESRSAGILFAGYFAVDCCYDVDGKTLNGRFYSSREWEKDAEVPIMYNPQNPRESCVCDEGESKTVAVALAILESLEPF